MGRATAQKLSEHSESARVSWRSTFDSASIRARQGRGCWRVRQRALAAGFGPSAIGLLFRGEPAGMDLAIGRTRRAQRVACS